MTPEQTEKLERRISNLKTALKEDKKSYNCNDYQRSLNRRIAHLESFKAGIEALEERIDRIDGNNICRVCGPMQGDVHGSYCLTGIALTKMLKSIDEL